MKKSKLSILTAVATVAVFMCGCARTSQIQVQYATKVVCYTDIAVNPDKVGENPGFQYPDPALGSAVSDKQIPDAEKSNLKTQYIRTNGYNENILYPQIIKVSSVSDLQDYYEKFKNIFNLSHKDKVYSDTTIGWLDAIERYDDKFFEENELVMVLLESGSGSTRYKVTGITETDGKYYLNIDIQVPEIGTCDMAEWHLFVESGDLPELSGIIFNNNNTPIERPEVKVTE